jgi:outer membrane protein assembly factor BamB
MKSYLSIIIIAIALFASCSRPQSSWTKWRGENGDGISKETNWDASKLDSSHILWKKNIGFGHSAIAVQGDNCFVTGWNEKISGKDTLGEAAIYCLNTLTGTEVWKYAYPSINGNFPGPRSTPIIDGKKLYAISWEGKLFCIDVQNGKENWTVNLQADSLTVMDNWGYCPSPVIFKDLLLLNLNKTGIALNKNTGKVVWKSEVGDSYYSSVQLVNYNGKISGVFMSGKKLNLVDPLTGKVLLSYEKKSEKGMNNDIMMTREGKLFTSDELLEVTNGSFKSLWTNDSITSNFRTGVIVNDYAYQFCNNRHNDNFNCINLKTGAPAWSEPLSGFGSVIAVSDKLIIITGKGKIIIADAKPDKFNALKELQVFNFNEKLNNWCWTAPTFCGGKLLVRNAGGDIVCIDLSI